MASETTVLQPPETAVEVFETKLTQLGNSVAIPVTGGLREQFDPQIKAGNWLLSIALGRGAMLCVEKEKFAGIDSAILLQLMGQVGSKMQATFMEHMATALSPAKQKVESDPLTSVLLNLAADQLATTSWKTLPEFDPDSFSRAAEDLQRSKRTTRAP